MPGRREQTVIKLMDIKWVVRKNKLTNSNTLKQTHRVCIVCAKIQTDTFLLITDKNAISSSIGVTFVKKIV